MSEMSLMQTQTGKAINLNSPNPDQIDIQDIAHALALTCRFGGHTKQFYSVAQHSVLVCDLVSEWTNVQEWQLLALLHDAHEAYVGDIIRPVQRLAWPHDSPHWIGPIEQAIVDCFGLRREAIRAASQIVKLADDTLLATEARDCLRDGPAWNWTDSLPDPLPEPIGECWPPETARQRFLDRYNALGRNAGLRESA